MAFHTGWRPHQELNHESPISGPQKNGKYASERIIWWLVDQRLNDSTQGGSGISLPSDCLCRRQLSHCPTLFGYAEIRWMGKKELQAKRTALSSSKLTCILDYLGVWSSIWTPQPEREASVTMVVFGVRVRKGIPTQTFFDFIHWTKASGTLNRAVILALMLPHYGEYTDRNQVFRQQRWSLKNGFTCVHEATRPRRDRHVLTDVQGLKVTWFMRAPREWNLSIDRKALVAVQSKVISMMFAALVGVNMDFS